MVVVRQCLDVLGGGHNTVLGLRQYRAPFIRGHRKVGDQVLSDADVVSGVLSQTYVAEVAGTGIVRLVDRVGHQSGVGVGVG